MQRHRGNGIAVYGAGRELITAREKLGRVEQVTNFQHNGDNFSCLHTQRRYIITDLLLLFYPKTNFQAV